MNTLKFDGTVKIPRAHGDYVAKKLKLRSGGNPENESDWTVCEEFPGTNLVLNQGMRTMILKGSDSYQFSNLFDSIRASDGSTAPDADDVSVEGTEFIATVNATLVEQIDAGLIGGREYTKVTREVTFYKGSGMVNGCVFRKVYGFSASVLGTLPISEILLPGPITVEDIETEAVKITYSIYFPRFGLAANNDFGKELVASGTLNIQERDSGGATSSGPSIDWEMYLKGHGYSQSTSGFYHERLPLLHADASSNSYVSVLEDAYRTVDVAEYTWPHVVSNPTPTSHKVDTLIKRGLKGTVGSDVDTFEMSLAATAQSSLFAHNRGQGPGWWLAFNPAINLDWRQTLEIQASITFDWT